MSVSIEMKPPADKHDLCCMFRLLVVSYFLSMDFLSTFLISENIKVLNLACEVSLVWRNFKLVITCVFCVDTLLNSCDIADKIYLFNSRNILLNVNAKEWAALAQIVARLSLVQRVRAPGFDPRRGRKFSFENLQPRG